MSKYYIITYGCQMNEHDSETIAAMLDAMGHEMSDDPAAADIVVMNTCSIRENADKRFYGMLGQFKNRKKSKNDFIMCVCGCMPQQEKVRSELKKRFGWVDIIFGTQTIDDFPNLLNERILTGKKQSMIVENNEELPEEKESKRIYHHKALVNITYGCNNFCTYCIVPYTRGREKSRSLNDIAGEVNDLVHDGVKEITLLGQNVNSFHDSEGNDFPTLIRRLNAIEELKRIRFMTSHPKDLSDDLIDCFRDCKKLCKHIHLPVQSGSNEILMRMNRKYDREHYLTLIKNLREVCPDIAVTTDIIVGFPGETEKDFQDTLSLVSEAKFDAAFTFIYSPRAGTPAAEYKGQISDSVKHERFDRLVDEVNRLSLAKNKTLEGNTLSVLVDGRSRKDYHAFSGRTDDFKLVNFSCDEDVTGKMLDIKIEKSKTFSLDGKIADNSGVLK